MGGRGASSGTSKLMGRGDRGGNRYGTMFRSVLGVDGTPISEGNIKFVEPTDANIHEEQLMETMTRGRVYALVENGAPKSIVYFDAENKRSKQIDLDERHGPGPHVHRGYYHNEYSPSKRPTGLLPKEREMVERVLAVWENKRGKS